MIARLAPWSLALALASLVAAPAPAPAQEEARTGETILKELEAVKPPQFDAEKREDRAYIESFMAEMGKLREKRSGLILELLNVDPKNERLPRLLIERWRGMFGDAEKLEKEIEEAVEKTGDADLKVEAAYIKVQMLSMMARDPEAALKAIDEFAAIAPKGDKRVGSLLFAASERESDPARKAEIEDRILKDFPDVADRVKASRRQREAIGKPFELEFDDAISGRSVRMADLKGKVVVVDFWATWCGPCIAEMPKMKELYAEFKEKGVEFIGVSLDQPEETGKGLTKLKEYVAENEIGWPQYYQGKGWEGSFSQAWGVNSIPRLFVVDQDGNLFSTQARGKLETMIPELLARKAADDKSGG